MKYWTTENDYLHTIKSKNDLKKFLINKGFPDFDADAWKDIEGIKCHFGISGGIRFRKCNNFPNSFIAWIDSENTNLDKLLLLRISNSTLRNVLHGKQTGIAFDLLVTSQKNTGRTTENVLYVEYHITTHNEIDAYDEPDDLDSTGEKKGNSNFNYRDYVNWSNYNDDLDKDHQNPDFWNQF